MTPPTLPIITIDGPSGVGKGTMASRLAAQLGYHLLDSGALYRLTALAALKSGVALEDEPTVAALASQLAIEFQPTAELVTTWLNGQEVSEMIRTEAMGQNASIVAALPKVRAALLQRQRDFAQPPGLVADGRDMGTTVFPAASVKFFLTATAEVRAERRYKQLIRKGLSADLTVLIREITERDERDQNRPLSPLKPAQDAITLDTSTETIEAVLKKMLEYLH